MELKCPYCQAELIEGFMYAGKYSFKWYTEDMSIMAKYFGFGGDVLSDNPKVICYRCKECNKLIVDLNKC
jgi:hypothetical protein